MNNSVTTLENIFTSEGKPALFGNLTVQFYRELINGVFPDVLEAWQNCQHNENPPGLLQLVNYPG